MKNTKYLWIALCVLLGLAGCEPRRISGTKADVEKTLVVAEKLQTRQPTPTDIQASLERFNLIRRAYWVNGARERAMALPCPVTNPPLGYVVLFSYGKPIGKFTVDGKVSSLNSYLTPDSDYYEVCISEGPREYNRWLPDVDGTYGTNDNGIFFFTADSKYVEWSGEYLYCPSSGI